LTLTETTEANKAEIKKAEKEFKDYSAKNEEENRAIWSAIERLAYEIRHLEDKIEQGQKLEASEREIFKLKIENELLKASRQLLPKPEEKD
jgi:predicted RNase H-like nuclease (RuvC/YqgF family)